MNWKTKRLADLITLERGFDLPKSSRIPGNVPVISSGKVEGTHNKAKIKGPGFTIGRITNLGRPRWSDIDYWPLNTTLYAKDFHGNNPRWLYYLFKIMDLSGYDSGSVQPALNRNYISEIPVQVPSIKEQDSIVSCISALDDKIAVNNRVISYSSSLNQLAVKQILAETEKTTTLGEEIILNYGKSLPVKSRIQGNVVVVGSGGIIGTHNEALLNTPSIIIGRKGSIGTIYWLDKPSFPIDTTFWVESKRLPLEFVFYLLKTIDFSGLNTDSAVPGLNRNHAYDIKIPSVADKQAKSVIERLQVFTRMISTLEQENQTLARTRDELLPLLMSGKITVRDAEEASAEVGVDKHEVEE